LKAGEKGGSAGEHLKKKRLLPRGPVAREERCKKMRGRIKTTNEEKSIPFYEGGLDIGGGSGERGGR